jgi:hypothetical protein
MKNLLFVFACFLTFALTAFAEEQYLGTVPAGGNNLGTITAQSDGGYTPTISGFLIAPGTMVTLVNPDAGPTTACVSSADAGCAHPLFAPAATPIYSKCKPSPTNYAFSYTLLDAGTATYSYSGCLIQGPVKLDVFIRRGDER